jgi:hypothetical protein
MEGQNNTPCLTIQHFWRIMEMATTAQQFAVMARAAEGIAMYLEERVSNTAEARKLAVSMEQDLSRMGEPNEAHSFQYIRECLSGPPTRPLRVHEAWKAACTLTNDYERRAGRDAVMALNCKLEGMRHG